MARRLTVSWHALLASMLLGFPRPLASQDGQPATEGIRFLMAAWSPAREVDTSTATVLRRRVSLDLTAKTLGGALREITQQADLEILYSPRVVPLDRPTSVRAKDLTVAAALTELLAGLQVDVSVTSTGGLALIKRSLPARSPDDTGSVTGRVTDSRSGSPLVGATVSIEGTKFNTATDGEGRYQIRGLASGEYTVRARYIGYSPTATPVTIGSGKPATLDFALERSVQELDQVIVTGTFVPTEIKALPSPVSVVNERDIAIQRPQNIQEIFRKAVPGAVSWANAHVPYDTKFSVRGASSLVPSSPSMKVLIDGIETANAGLSQIDPASIARVEVIRGPQAAAIYGSEAIGGVIQVFTKRGDPDLARPKVGAEAAAGVAQTPYSGFREVLRQEYKASIRGGALGMGYHLGAGYSHLDDWLPPAGEISRQSTPSIHGGLNISQGVVSADITGRYYDQKGGNNLSNPVLLETGFVPFSKPYYQPHRSQNLTVGTQLSVAPRRWWRTNVKAGLDRRSVDIAQTRPRLTTPDDTLLQVTSRAEIKPSVGFNSTIEGSLASGLSASVTAGVDHWSYTLSGFSTLEALTTSGSIRLAPGANLSADRIVTRNTGYFAQLQAGFRDALFVTAGLRAERNTDFGDSLGTPLLPRVGLTYVRPVGQVTVKLRGSWGRAIKPPSPGAKAGFTSSFRDQLPNPELGPERQGGWDAGFDASFGSTGSFGLTYYDQIAEDLIDLVVQLTPESTQQFQNVGRVRNTGIELEGTLIAGALRVQGQYGYARARIERLSPSYAGALLVGDQAHLRPRHTLGATATVTPGTGTTLSAGAMYLGSWTSTDFIALIRCFGGTAPCRPTQRDYLVRSPALLKINASMVQQLTPAIAGFVAIDNLTNNENHEVDNIGPVMGRITTVGIRLEY